MQAPTSTRQDCLSPIPSPKCRVVYFDGLERVVMASDTTRPVYPKDPTAPICPWPKRCSFGLAEQAA